MAVNSFNAQNPPVTTKGDVFTFSTIPTRLGVGANNTVLTADSAEATGLKWATVSAGGWSSLATGNLTGTTVTLSSISQSYENLVLILRDFYPDNDSNVRFTVNNTNDIYASASASASIANNAINSNTFSVADQVDATDGDNILIIIFNDYTSSTNKFVDTKFVGETNTGTNYNVVLGYGAIRLTSAINRIDLILSGGNSYSAGTYELFGVK